MANEYNGVKFQTRFTSKKPVKSTLIPVLQKWAAVFAAHGFAPPLSGGFGGNLSLRYKNNFLITASGADLGNLSSTEIVLVNSIDLVNNCVDVCGCCHPSSETILHAQIYQLFSDVNAVFHGHYPPFEENSAYLNLPVTEKETPYGSRELIKETLKIINKGKVVLLKNHGFISIGETAEEAGNQILALNHKISRLPKPH